MTNMEVQKISARCESVIAAVNAHGVAILHAIRFRMTVRWIKVLLTIFAFSPPPQKKNCYHGNMSDRKRGQVGQKQSFLYDTVKIWWRSVGIDTAIIGLQADH